MRRAGLFLVMLVLILSTVYSAGNNEKAAPTTIVKNSMKVWVSSGAEDTVYKTLFTEMEKELGAEIVDEYYPKDELDSKLQVAQVVGDAPDMIIVDYLQIPAYYETGLVAPLDSRISKDLLSDLIPSVVAESTYDGKLVSVAQFDAGMGLWANKSMLEKAGVRIPTSYKNAWSKAEFEDALKKLKDSGVKSPIYIRQNKPSSLYFTYMPVLASFGGDYVNRKTMLAKGTLDSEETIAAYDYMSYLMKQGYLDGSVDYENAFFGRKESALALIGHWKYTDHVTNLGDDAIVIPTPDFGKGVFTCSGSTVWAMTTTATENGSADLVWKVLEKSLDPKYMRMVTDFNGAIPSRKSVMDTVTELQKGGRLYIYREQLEAGISVLRPLTPAHMTIYTAMQNATADILFGADARSTLVQTAKEIDEVILENGWNL
ncbi:MAG: extracellular solute-binding protein [Sphaerochaeta associata]|uniref:sugar ABC transporter substrate-binding protein n=1 Tax=Sphaerochaeta associata TaxID=1129264 RepID=UPI002B2063D2|nr:extracellular solute-binding protein [Sphaerochaeta associata]MEA5105930.1 extracellular solute-binding protein [Sphaerochaeta associata]